MKVWNKILFGFSICLLAVVVAVMVEKHTPEQTKAQSTTAGVTKTDVKTNVEKLPEVFDVLKVKFFSGDHQTRSRYTIFFLKDGFLETFTTPAENTEIKFKEGEKKAIYHSLPGFIPSGKMIITVGSIEDID